MKKFSIITPCFNAEHYIEETMLSVINQSILRTGAAELEYIICDGGSRDRTVSIIEAVRDRHQCNFIKIISEPDSGMYDALTKGLKAASGDITAYINAGDYYHPTALQTVLPFFEKKGVHWLTGYNVVYNNSSAVVYVELPFKYRPKFFSYGFYGTKLPALQQESTFWSTSLNQLLDYSLLSKLKYAGDYYLWVQFSQKHEIKIVESYLGGFRIHGGQISGDKTAYYQEVDSLVQQPGIFDLALASLDRLLWYAPHKIKKLLNPENLFRFNHDLQEWI